MNKEDIPKIVDMYVNGKYTLRHLSELFGTNHHMIKRVLVKNGVEIMHHKTLKRDSSERKMKRSTTMKDYYARGNNPHNKGKKLKDVLLNDDVRYRDIIYNNMQCRLRHDVDIEWLKSFDDIEKLKFLNRSISRVRDFGNFDKEFYVSYIEKFYIDERFNEIYSKWLINNDKYLRPSPDHINPKSLGGKLDDINNIQFMTWFENKCKSDIPNDIWDEMKKNINVYFL